jgi:hypothetical protein
MANNNTTSRVTVTANSEQARQEIEKLKKQAEDTKKAIDGMISSGNLNTPEAIKTLGNLQKEYKGLETQINKTEKANIDFETVLRDVSGKTQNELNKLRTALNTSLKGMEESAQNRKKYEGYLETISAQINKLSKGYTQAAQAAQNADDLSMSSKRKVLTQLRN